MADRGAEIPNHSTTISNIVLKGTAPDEPATRRDKLSKNTIANMKLNEAVNDLFCTHQGRYSRGQDSGGQERIFSAISASEGCVNPA